MTGTLLIVAGMHRSGTSAITRTLNLMGAAIPGTVVPAGEDENPRGFWESREIEASHERFLAAVGSSWHDLRPIEAGAFSSGAADRCCADLAALVRASLDTNPLAVVKDPRICRLVPLWRRAAEMAGAKASFVIPVRDPLEIAQSLRVRNGFIREYALMMWLGHMLAAERATRGARRWFVAYSRCVDDPQGEALRMADGLGCFNDAGRADRLAAIGQFWTGDLYRQRRRCDAGGDGPELPPWVGTVQGWLTEACEGKAPGTAVMDEAWDGLAHLTRSLGRLLDPDRMFRQEDMAERMVAATRDVMELRLKCAAAQGEGLALRETVAALKEANRRQQDVLVLFMMALGRECTADFAHWRGESLQRLHDGLTPVPVQFDAEYYRRENPDVAQSGLDPLVHYLRFGLREGRRPYPPDEPE